LAYLQRLYHRNRADYRAGGGGALLAAGDPAGEGGHVAREPGFADCPDGGCIWRVEVAHTLEIKPWMRGWRPDCEVLAPEGLRQEVGEEMRRAAAEVYGG
jgi:predicted DNA-binding transcriptional regulator YafY